MIVRPGVRRAERAKTQHLVARSAAKDTRYGVTGGRAGVRVFHGFTAKPKKRENQAPGSGAPVVTRRLPQSLTHCLTGPLLVGEPAQPVSLMLENGDND